LIGWLWVRRRFDALVGAALFLVALKWIAPAVLQGTALSSIFAPALAGLLALTLFLSQKKPGSMKRV
jgi:phosphate/sulfate permease